MGRHANVFLFPLHMPLPTDRAASLAIFCKVVDNYGDIGICWRLARQLSGEHGVAVTLWVDDLPSFQRICPEVDVAAEAQHVSGVTVRHWRGQDGAFAPADIADIADIVIEFFACDIPPGYIAAMAQCAPQPVWLNLEGLTAEEWVEGCHALTSPRRHDQAFLLPGFLPIKRAACCARRRSMKKGWHSRPMPASWRHSWGNSA